MEYLEIILKNIKKSYLDQIVGGYIILDKTDIISSYFFDKENNKNLSYAEIKSLEVYFNECNTCTLYAKKIQIGIELEDVLILISHVVQLCKCCEIPNWIMGYEPAKDSDMKIIEWKECYF